MLPVLAAVGALVAAPLVYAATRPDRFRVERSALIAAPPEAIYPHLVDLHRWSGWSPWEKLDPEMTRTHSGPESGPGAAYAWKGNRKAGEGRMEITAATPPSRLELRLDFVKPFAATNTTEFLLLPEDGGTRVTWAMYGRSNYGWKVMGLVMNMDRMIGRDFEEGLDNLRQVVEGHVGG